jgi:hypothetical protein
VYTLDEALRIVAEHNSLGQALNDQMRRITLRAVEYLPASVKASFRPALVPRDKPGKFISFNLKGYLLFRVPAFSDPGRPPPRLDTCHIRLPTEYVSNALLRRLEANITWRFKFECVDIASTFSHIIAFSEQDWHKYREACEMTFTARPVPSRLAANITID